MEELLNGIACSNIVTDTKNGGYKLEFSPGRLVGSIILTMLGGIVPTIVAIKKVRSAEESR